MTVVMLLPAATDTKWWFEDVLRAKEIRFLRGRLKFEYRGQAYYPARMGSAIVVFGGDRRTPREPHVSWIDR
jgi:hypothetical protein